MRENMLESYIIESRLEADEYLSELLENEEYRTVEEVHIRAEKYIQDALIKKYFIEKAEEMLLVFR
jgi:hypothetical protein